MSEIGIGSTVWTRANFSRDSTVDEAKICGETKRSWLISRGEWYAPFKIAKSGLDSNGERWSAVLERDRKLQVFLTLDEWKAWEAQRQAQREKWQWISKHRENIRYAVGNCQDPAILRQIAALVGYTEGK